MTTWQRLSAVLYDPFFWLAERAGLAARRRALVQQARGRVLEIGAGTGLNLRHYADDAELVLSEPDAAMADRLRRRVAGRRRPATVVLAPAEALPFADGEFDTWSPRSCSAPCPTRPPRCARSAACCDPAASSCSWSTSAPSRRAGRAGRTA